MLTMTYGCTQRFTGKKSSMTIPSLKRLKALLVGLIFSTFTVFPHFNNSYYNGLSTAEKRIVVKSILTQALESNDPAIFSEAFSEASFIGNITTINDEPLLHLAVRKNRIKIVEFLLYEHAVSVDEKDTNYDKETALMAAVRRGHVGCIVLLLNANADIMCIDGKGKNVFERTVQDWKTFYFSSEKLKTILSLLLDKNAELNSSITLTNIGTITKALHSSAMDTAVEREYMGKIKDIIQPYIVKACKEHGETFVKMIETESAIECMRPLSKKIPTVK